jgi:hypothetical protein
MKTSILPLLIVACFVLGCGGEQDSSRDSQPAGDGVRESVARPGHEPSTKVIVTSDDASLPDGCRPREIAELGIGFINAFNSGDQNRLAQLFFISEGPSPPDFSQRGYYPWSWYSVSEVGAGGRIKDGFVTYNQGELLRYFAEKHRQGERLELLKVSATQAGLLGTEGNAGIVYIRTRDAEDLDPGLGGSDRIATGKGPLTAGASVSSCGAWR